MSSTQSLNMFPGSPGLLLWSRVDTGNCDFYQTLSTSWLGWNAPIRIGH